MLHTDTNAIRQLADVDAGAYVQPLAAWRAGAVDEGVAAGALVAAECALYLDDLETARRLAEPHAALIWLDAAGERGDVARRARLILAEAAYAEQDYATAADLARPVIEVADGADDTRAAVRALYCLARTAFRRGAVAVALERFDEVERRAGELGNVFYAGLAHYFRGFAAHAAGDHDSAGRELATAVDTLGRAEGRRRYANALAVYGAHLTEIGRAAEATVRLDEGRRILVGLGLPGDLAHVDANAARALCYTGEYAEAVERFGALVDEHRRAGHPAEIASLQWLSTALYHVGRAEEAVRAATAMLELATLIGTPADAVDARLIRARARAEIPTERDVAIVELRALAAADLEDYTHAEALVYLAGALCSDAPTEAAEILSRAGALDAAWSSVRLSAEIARVEAALARSAVRVDGERFVVEPRLGAVVMARAVAELERFLFVDALARSDGDVVRAGDRIGWGRSESYRRAKLYGVT